MRKGSNHSEETKKIIGLRSLGRKHSDETKKKMSLAHKGRQYTLGHKLTADHKRKIGESQRNKVISLEHRERLSLLRKKEVGENNHNWKGGISFDKEYMNFLVHRRRERIRGNGGTHTFEEWINLKKSFNNACPSCKKSEPEIMLTVDHIIPVSKGGRDDIGNIQPLCLHCNQRKLTKIISYV